MTQQEEELVEDFLECFTFSLQCSRHPYLTLETIKMLFLRGIHDETMDALNLIGKGDISKMSFEDICDICRNYSRSHRSIHENSSKFSTMGNASGISKREIGNLLEDLKTDLLNHMGKQIDTLYSRRKHEEAEKALVVYCPTCYKNHGLEDYPYN